MDAKWVLVSVSCVGLLLGLVAILLLTSYMACQWGDQHQHRDFRPAHQLICGKTLKLSKLNLPQVTALHLDQLLCAVPGAPPILVRYGVFYPNLSLDM